MFFDELLLYPHDSNIVHTVHIDVSQSCWGPSIQTASLKRLGSIIKIQVARLSCFQTLIVKHIC